MGSSVSDLVTGMKVFADTDIHHYDAIIPPTPWRDNEFLQVQTNKPKIKIGILKESTFLPCSKAVKRAMKITEKALQDLGYEVVEIAFPQEIWEQGRNLIVSMLLNGPAPQVMKDFLNTGEALLPPIRDTINIAFASRPVRFLIDQFLKLSN